MMIANHPMMISNHPSLWEDKIKKPTKEGSKYTRGWAVVLGGAKGKTGAAKLASVSALRAGAGLVTLCHTKATAGIYEPWALSVMTSEFKGAGGFLDFIKDERVKAVLLGPGAGLSHETAEVTLGTLKLGKPCVLDGDALTVFAQNPHKLMAALHKNAVLTPHMGEFARLFATEGTKAEMALKAAKEAGCTICLKGSDTVITSQTGEAVTNQNASPWLATAGTGDVLAGIITGLLANGMQSFDAACAGVYIHAKAAELCGKGMISEDLCAKIPLATP